MKIIPVIDLKNGLVVHAHHGLREHYRPIQSRLCQSADLSAVLEGFLNLAAFDTFYIADLNAITQQGDHEQLLNKVLAAFPDIQFWLDKGYQTYESQIQMPVNCIPVLGSECYQDDMLNQLELFKQRFILSLDYSLSGALGAPALFTSPALWPDHLIIMTLAQVGSHQGPDFAKLHQFCTDYPDKNFIAAGGVRHVEDLIQLEQLGIQQALVASSLHSGAIKQHDIDWLINH